MEYNSLEYRIMRYLAKPKKSGLLMLAHLKALKPVGKNYNTLVDLQKRRDNKEEISELIPWTDGEFDMEKVKQVFLDQGIAKTATDFDTKVTLLRTNNYISPVKFEAATKAVMEFDTKEAEQITLIENTLK